MRLATNIMVWRSPLEARDGTIWAGFWNPLLQGSPAGDPGLQGGISRFDGSRWQVYAPEALFQVSGNTVGTPVQDGSVWVFVFNQSRAFRFDSQRLAISYTHRDSLHGGYEAADESVWFYTRRQAVRLKNGVWLGYGAEDDFLDGEVGIIPFVNHQLG
jgi:hypothetical protein